MIILWVKYEADWAMGKVKMLRTRILYWDSLTLTSNLETRFMAMCTSIIHEHTLNEVRDKVYQRERKYILTFKWSRTDRLTKTYVFEATILWIIHARVELTVKVIYLGKKHSKEGPAQSHDDALIERVVIWVENSLDGDTASKHKDQKHPQPGHKVLLHLESTMN